MKRLIVGSICALVTTAAIVCLWLSRSFIGGFVLAAYVICLWLSHRYDEDEGMSNRTTLSLPNRQSRNCQRRM